MEISIENVPVVSGRVVVCPDVSGSMKSPVTRVRPGAATAVRCVDVASLVAAAVLRRNLEATVLPFEHDVVDIRLGAMARVLANATALARIGGGGTSCSAPLARLCHPCVLVRMQPELRVHGSRVRIPTALAGP